MKATLTRNWYDKKQTLGQLEVGDLTLYTLELPWLENQRRISCIPEGTYKVTSHVSKKFGKCFWLREVPNRTGILIHAGNYHWHTLGCILVGLDHKDANKDGLLDVVSSSKAMKQLLEYDITEIEIKTI